jgi:succinyl-CoA synthetase alpha subunit
VLIGGPGSHDEEAFAQYYASLENKKPVIAFLVGHFIDQLAGGFYFGHRSTIQGENGSSVSQKKKVLEASGIQVVKFIQDIPTFIKR